MKYFQPSHTPIPTKGALQLQLQVNNYPLERKHVPLPSINHHFVLESRNYENAFL